MVRDLQFGLRMLWKQPGFTAVALITLALGIGAASGVFTLVRGVLLTPPPYQEPDRLALIQSEGANGNTARNGSRWAPAQLFEWRRRAESFDSIAGYAWTFSFLIRADGSEPVEGLWVTNEYFRTIGVEPLLGRGFLEAEHLANPSTAIILGYDLWQRSFEGDPDILGKTVRMRDDHAPTVVGVMPPGVRFLPAPGAAQEPNYDVNALVDYWLPAGYPPDQPNRRMWYAIGRLRDGRGLGDAQSELTILTARQAEGEPELAGLVPQVESFSDFANSEAQRVLLPLFGAALLVLVIACGNVAALLLVRGLQRQQEYAVRSAMGVSRTALLRQASAEGLLLAALGGGLGVALAFTIVDLLKRVGGHAIPRLDAVSLGWPALLWSFAAAAGAALLAGVVPALRAIRTDPMSVLKDAGPKSSPGRADRRLLRTVTMLQTALTVILLFGAGLLIRTMINLANVPSGFETGHVLTMSVTSVEGSWIDFHTRALEKVSALPGVRHAAFAWGVPLTGNSWPATAEIEGQPAPATDAERIPLPLRAVTPGYFELLGQSIAEGRDFRASDNREGEPAAVVNEAFVTRYFPDTAALGKKVWLQGRDNKPSVIVGVATNARTADLTQPAQPEVYLSLWQANAFSKHLVVRTAGDPFSIAGAVQRELRAINPSVGIAMIKTLDQVRGESLASRTFAMQLLVGFAAAASLLTLVGVYGVLALAVASRRREIAIRAAVGAQGRDIRSLIFAEGFRLIGAGVAAGIAGSFLLSRALDAFLFEVKPSDPATLAGVAVLLAAVGLLASWLPARRATLVNPVDALRSE